ncbi:signal peptidase I [Spongisporangium articulatum]|uniref:Signal peptidase I n=1 Tax=Spongisporangium articulatum TaxID=3362603 RepID=A0ABW8AN05_9ACTN
MTQSSHQASSAAEGEPVSEKDLQAPGADADDEQDPVRAFLSMIREIVLVLVIALGLSLLIKTFLMQAFFIPSPSMENTLIVGDRVLVSKLTPGPFELKRGDIVVFSDPGNWLPATTEVDEGAVRNGIRAGLTFVGLLPANSDEHLIKRVIGLPGDKISCCDSAGRLLVNGKPINEPYVYPNDNPSDKPFSVTVPAGHLWVMGDHRSVSADSRAHLKESTQGFVPIDDVVGKAFVLVWPLNRATLLHNPSSTFAGVPAAGK